MTELVVDRLLTRAEVRDGADEARVRRLVDDIARGQVEPDLAGASVADGLWCVRRVEVRLELDGPGQPDLGRAWAASLRAALLEELAGRRPTRPGQGSSADDGELVGYRRREDALADLLASLALGHPARVWAWRSLGILDPQDPDPAHEPRAAALAVLHRNAGLLMPALVMALPAAGPAALHRLLGSVGWRSLAATVLGTAGTDPELWLSAVPRDAGPPSAAGVLVSPLLRRSALARSWLAAPPLLEPDALAALVALVVSDAEPALLRRRPDAGLRAAIAARLSPDATTGPGLVLRPGPHVEPEPEAAADPESPPAGAAPVDDRREEATPAELDPARDPSHREEQMAAGLATRWGGLVHLLATAASAGVPDTLLADPALADLLPSDVLHHLLVMLASTADDGRRGSAREDPAVAALSSRGSEVHVPPEPTGATLAALEGHAARWRQETATRLGATDPLAAMAALLPREGRVVTWPGWTEFRLSLADVDLDVRRAGLDLDPGFVPWLGAVVVIRYV